jgi:hypothetical protein
MEQIIHNRYQMVQQKRLGDKDWKLAGSFLKTGKIKIFEKNVTKTCKKY